MEKQKKWKFNIIDALFLLVVLAGVLFVILRAALPDQNARTHAKEEYYAVTFTCDAVPENLLNHLRIGAAVTDDKATCDMGTVVDFQLGPSAFYDTDNSGKLIKTSRDGYQSLLLTCCVRGADNGYGITVDDLALGVGHSMSVRAGEVRFNMVVYDIQKFSDTSYPFPET